MKCPSRGISSRGNVPEGHPFDSFSEKPTTHPLSRSAKNCGVGWQDIADVVAFLISEQGKWITGHNIQACGGVVM